MRAALGGAVLAAALAMWAARVLVQSRASLREGEAALAAGDVDGALESLGRAARLHVPGSPWSRAALGRLEELATDAESRGAPEAALPAWREVRSALRATRAVFPRDRGLGERADSRIAALSAALESPSVDPGSDERSRAGWYAERLARDDAPGAGWSLLALGGMALWVASALALISRGLDERLRPRRRPALLFASGVVLGLALFLVGLARA